MKYVESMWEQSQQITAGGGNTRWRQDSKWTGAREAKKQINRLNRNETYQRCCTWFEIVIVRENGQHKDQHKIIGIIGRVVALQVKVTLCSFQLENGKKNMFALFSEQLTKLHIRCLLEKKY